MSELETLKEAAKKLESEEEEYLFSRLVAESALSESVVKQLLKTHWIERDDLDIVYLNLNSLEEAELYPVPS